MLRIAQIATPHERTPPVAYGSINRIVADLCDELVARGHEVHLYATGDSRTRADLHSTFAAPDAEFVNVGYDWMHTLESLRAAHGFDVLHDHNLFSGSALNFLSCARVAFTTAHFYTHRDREFLRRAGGRFVVQSQSQAWRMRRLRLCGLVEPGIALDHYQSDADDSGYLLVLGQIADHKGVREAIGVSQESGLPVVLAGPVPPGCEDYFEQHIRPALGRQVEYVGEVGGEQRAALLRRARGLLMLSKVPETFGLAALEAMASGTPVVVSGRGALREVVVHGVTGFIAEDRAEQVRAVQSLGDLTGADCREHVRGRYTVGHMADRYLALYESLLGGHDSAAGSAYDATEAESVA